MVLLVRSGVSLRQVARQFGVSLLTVQRWVKRAEGTETSQLHRLDWSDRSHGRHHVTNRTPVEIEVLILALRQELQKNSDLGEYGAQAIYRDLVAHPDLPAGLLPSVATINRILARHGVFDKAKRVRRPPPPPGWYLPDVAAGRAELDEFDAVIGLVIEGGQDVEVLNAVSVHGGLVGSWPEPVVTAQVTRQALVEHWQIYGRPDYVQFDNDMRFTGTHKHPDSIGTVIRLCLSLSVVPVFAPVRETGFQAAIESYNNRWQQKVWQRFHFENLSALKVQSNKYVAAVGKRFLLRQERAPLRRPFPVEATVLPKQVDRLPLAGKIVFLRRTNAHGQADLLGRTFEVAPHWAHRLVRAEVHIDEGCLQFYALRRREPQQQPLLKETKYVLPNKYGAH